MPPKGSRKASAAQAKPTATEGEVAPEPDVEGETGEGLEAFELPKAPVMKLARAAGPQNMKLAKEVPTALQKASTVFISYLAAAAHDIAAKRSEKTLSAQHVLEACKMLDWDDEDELLRVLKSELESFRRGNKAKREASKAAKTASTAVAATAADEEPMAGPIAGTSGAKPSSVLSESTLGKRPHADVGEAAEDGDDQETVDDEDAGRYLGQSGVEEVDLDEEEDDEAMDLDEGAAGEEEDDAEDSAFQEGEPTAADT